MFSTANTGDNGEKVKASRAGSTLLQESSQDALLKLLKRSASASSQQKPPEPRKSQDLSFSFENMLKSNSTSTKAEAQPAKAAQDDSSARKPSPIRMFGTSESRETTPFEPPATTAIKENKPIFTYINPFEALHASRKATPQPSGSGIGSPVVGSFPTDLSNGDKRKSNEATLEQASTRRKLTPRGPLRSSSSVQPTAENASAIEQHDAVTDLASKEAEKTMESVEIKQEDHDPAGEIDEMINKMEKTTIDAAASVKKELDKGENKGVLEEEMAKPVASAVKEVIDDAAAAAEAAPAESWETSDAPTDQAQRDVPVYNFPLKPFISITITDLPLSKVGLRDDGVMEISRFKKEFDQLDRTLASATSKYITYAFVKNGGIRVIRQDDGSDRHVFKNSGDRVFHVTLCTTTLTAPPTDQQGVLGVGLSGAVYYATISRDGNDLFENDSLDTESLIFPPHPPGDENSSGGGLKTRARRSSRHPEFFAISRGRSIHLVWPATAMSTKYGVNGSDRTVDIEKLYKDRPLKITTGKAGKDFVFSEDDTLIVSLDKTGKLRFWDIRKLVNESNATASKVQAEDISVPILTLSTASATEKSWPTSVLFVDKVRPYTKGTALRYLLVGMKQNHTLQLWDIALGKAVQELNFPHDTETDGICSVAYHPNSGIIVVGHPTRNSIFFLHLSAPRYTLQPMSQATYLERIAIRDPDLPKPEATACMSGMRELSFASKGQLRSIDLLPAHKPADAPKDSSDAQTLFELYVVHSRGVTCLAVTKEDLGWSPESKVLHPVDNAIDVGMIKVSELRYVASSDEADVNGATEPSQSAKSSRKKSIKPLSELSGEAVGTKDKHEQLPVTAGPAANTDLPNGAKTNEVNTASGVTPSEKDKRKKKKSALGPSLAPSPSVKGPENNKSPSQPLSPSKTSTPATDPGDRTPTSTSGDNMASGRAPQAPALPFDPEIANVEVSNNWLGTEMEKFDLSLSATELNQQFEMLYRRIANERNVQDAAALSRYETLLRVVQNTLAENVDHALNQIIGKHMQQRVLPAISNLTAQAIQTQVGEALAHILHGVVPREIGTQLPVAISTAMQNPTHVRNLSEQIVKLVTPSLEAHFAELMRSTISPTFQRLAVGAAVKATSEIESRVGVKLQQYDMDRQNDAVKIEKLEGYMRTMMEMMTHLSESQIAFQEKVIKDRNNLTSFTEASSRPPSSAATAFRTTPLPTRQVSSVLPSPIAPPPRKKTAEDIEMEEIRNFMGEGRFEEASIKWLQSAHSVELFDKLLVNYTPDFLQNGVSPLVAFSVGVTIANSFERNVQQRLEWIYTALNTVDTRVSFMSFLI